MGLAVPSDYTDLCTNETSALLNRSSACYGNVKLMGTLTLTEGELDVDLVLTNVSKDITR